ncbi:unnamed protein product [Schistosoma curassoni]|uniref:TROVE domain-containing protein n=1 Tax=Schistosoma curassoni TaxID=6186 RepID=A0A183JGY4_9TREM|nr:unnamed protein product [Schistosoma curassoni]
MGGMKAVLQRSLLRTSDNRLRKTRFTESKLQLNYDGLSLFKISNQQPWPMLCRITSPLVSNVFIVGIYGGEVKPSDFNNMSAAPITELHELLTVGINVDKFQAHLTVILVAVICNALARSNVSLKRIVEDVIEHGSLESFSAFPFESYMRKIRRSVHCGFAAAKQAAQRYAEEVYFQSILNQDMADNNNGPELTYDSSKEIINYRNSKLSTTRPDNVVIANGWPGRLQCSRGNQSMFKQQYPATILTFRQLMRRCRVQRKSQKGKLFNSLNQFCVRAAKRKLADYLCTSEELKVVEVEAGFAPVEFPVVKILSGTFSPIASSSSIPDVWTPPIPSTSTEVNKPMILKVVTELSSKMDKVIASNERLSVGVIHRRMDEMDTDAITFPIRTHENLRSLEAALDNRNSQDHFVARLCNLLCDDARKSAKACLQYLLLRKWQTLALCTEPEVNSVLVNTNFPRRFKASPHYRINIFVGALCSRFRSATCPEKEIIHAVGTASRIFLHDARDKVHKRGWRSKNG